MKKSKKQITLNELARMVAKGFAESATKQDIKDMATKQDLAKIEARLTKLEEIVQDHSQRLASIDMKLDRALYREVTRIDDLIRQLARKVKVKLEY